ncbi:squalene synthase HpnC [Labrys okinawensis]|uniref:squalene synthase HpnC n=1 Tax=Labrys okinawensis TaxID=346911 RepID=UPI0039BC5448
MDSAASARTGKGSRDENFPVASWLIADRHRPPIMAFYDFVRTADDVADHPELAPAEKLGLLDQLEAGLLGVDDHEPAAVKLRSVLADHGLSPRHALDLLHAFRTDVTKLRYEDWDALMEYCSFSAMPVGRYVLDVHGESQALWPVNDALCAALQIINHLQDCGEDYRALDRIYVPLQDMRSAGVEVSDLGQGHASPALLRCLSGLAARTERLLDDANPFAWNIRDGRLSLEVGVIHSLAVQLVQLLKHRDPLSQRVHIGKARAFGTMIAVLVGRTRFGRRNRVPGRRLPT